MPSVKPLLLLLSGAALLLQSCSDKEEAEAPPPPRPVLSLKVEEGAATSRSFSGSIQPRNQLVLGFQIFGRLIARAVDVGDRVAAGQVIATLDSTAQETTLRSAEANLEIARAALVNANNTLDRVNQLLPSGNATPADLEVARQTQKAAMASVAGREADLSKARDQLTYTEIRAPFEGIVTDVFAQAGQTVTAGQNIVTLAEPRGRDAVVDIPDAIATTLKPGTPFKVSLQLDPSFQATGLTREIEPVADSTTRTRRVKILLDNPAEEFRIGSTVEARLTAAGDAALDVPGTAVLQDGNDAFVWVIDAGQGVVTKRKVEAEALPDGSFAIHKGLEAGQSIAVAGVHSLKDGQKIKVGEAQ